MFYQDFVRRNGQFSVSIGLCDNHEPVLGVIYVPCSTIGPPRVYYAVEGGGAYVRNLESSLVPSDSGSEADSTAPQPKHKLSIITPTRLEADAFYESDKNLRILAHTPSFGAESMKAFLGSYSSPDISTGAGGGFSLLNLMSIAEGKAHILPRLASSCEWNTCAAHAIINEAGGEILQVAGGAVACTGAQLEYNKPHPLNPHFIAYGKRLILSPAASPSMSQMRGISTHMTPTLLDTVADRRSESFRSLREDVIDESDDDLEELSEGSEQRSEDGVLKNPRRLFQSVVDPHGRSHFKSSPSHRGSVNDGGGVIAQLQTEHSEDHEVRKEINGVHTVKKGNDGGHQDSENGPERIGSSLYGNMLFTFLVASFVVLLGWVLLPSPVNLE